MFDIKENLKKLPDTPGVYMHKDKLGQVIYVGKAISLRNRVRQYFQASANHSPKVKAMVSHIAEFEYITCQTEMEALILECNLIKKYAPKYNVLLRDDKTYPYIKVTVQEEYPRVLKTRLIEKDGSKYFGPYSDAGAVNQIIDLLNKIFVLKRCSAKSFPPDFRPCLNFHIGECRGICAGYISPQDYRKYVDRALEFLGGRQKPLLDYLTDKMTLAAEELNFEEAAVYRDYITSVKSLGEVQRVTMVGGKDLDMVLPVGSGENASVVLFTVRAGKLSGRETFNMSAEGEDDYDSLVGEFIKQYYSQWAVVPGEIIVPKPLKEAELIEKYLESQGEGRKVRIFVPQKGDKRALLELAKRDVVEMAKTLEIKVATAREKEETLRAALAKITGREQESYRVESYDISNTNGVDTVGAMVVFRNLKPVRKDYRRFKIRTVEGPDDYGSLTEMLTRRFKRALDGDPSFSTLPDLILMDGGQGQVSVAEKVLRELGISLPVLGMAKDDSHRTRALVDGQGNELELRDDPLLFKYCGTIQEEVHRFAIEYHRSLHNKNTIGSVLDNVRGIGPAKRNALLSHFNSIEDIKKASAEKLMEVDGITEKNAQAIKEYFGQTEDKDGN
ncbi:MAG: excinuclease ABC subunit UvrC [Firmicutes bacterium]|nr:excinuclease ABC subunit UvrC [Bacillota bacterium]